MNLVTERFLLLKIKRKDRNAAEKLINEHYKKVYYFLLKLCKEKELAQDLTQETFIKAWYKIESFNGKSRFSTWLYRISYNLFIDHIRSLKGNKGSFEENEIFYLKDNIQLDERLSDKDLYLHLIRMVNELPEKLKEVIIFHYDYDLSFNEISGILAIPKGTVKSRLNSALNQLRKALNELEKG